MCEKKPYCNRKVDECLQKTVWRINRCTDFKCVLCCCGHGKYHHTILMRNKSTGQIFELFSKLPFQKRKNKKYYVKDTEGYYYIPEVEEFYQTTILSNY